MKGEWVVGVELVVSSSGMKSVRRGGENCARIRTVWFWRGPSWRPAIWDERRRRHIRTRTGDSGPRTSRRVGRPEDLEVREFGACSFYSTVWWG